MGRSAVAYEEFSDLEKGLAMIPQIQATVSCCLVPRDHAQVVPIEQADQILFIVPQVADIIGLGRFTQSEVHGTETQGCACIQRKNVLQLREQQFRMCNHLVDTLGKECPDAPVAHAPILGQVVEIAAVGGRGGHAFRVRIGVEGIAAVVPRDWFEFSAGGVPIHPQIVAVPRMCRRQYGCHRAGPGPFVGIEVFLEEFPVASLRAGSVLGAEASYNQADCLTRLIVAGVFLAEKLSFTTEGCILQGGRCDRSGSARTARSPETDRLLDRFRRSTTKRLFQHRIP